MTRAVLNRQLSLAVVASLGLAAVAGCGPKTSANVDQTISAEDCRAMTEELARLELALSEDQDQDQVDHPDEDGDDHDSAAGEVWVSRARVDSIKQMNEGIRQLQMNNLAGAERAMAEAISIDPTYAEAYLNLGKLYRKQQKWTDAEKMFRSAIDRMGDEPRADYYFELGAVQVAQGHAPGVSHVEQRTRWHEAIVSFSDAIDVDPSLFKAHYQIGTLREKLDEPEQADSAYRKCIELAPHYSPCFVSLGNMYIDYGYPKVAMAVLETGTRINRTDADMWNGTGRAMLALNRPSDAIDAYRKARSIDPDKPDVLFGLGMAYAEIPMREEAIETLTEFLSKAGTSPEHIKRAAQDTIMRMEGPI